MQCKASLKYKIQSRLNTDLIRSFPAKCRPNSGYFQDFTGITKYMFTYYRQYFTLAKRVGILFSKISILEMKYQGIRDKKKWQLNLDYLNINIVSSNVLAVLHEFLK